MTDLHLLTGGRPHGAAQAETGHRRHARRHVWRHGRRRRGSAGSRYGGHMVAALTQWCRSKAGEQRPRTMHSTAAGASTARRQSPSAVQTTAHAWCIPAAGTGTAPWHSWRCLLAMQVRGQRSLPHGNAQLQQERAGVTRRQSGRAGIASRKNPSWGLEITAPAQCGARREPASTCMAAWRILQYTADASSAVKCCLDATQHTGNRSTTAAAASAEELQEHTADCPGVCCSCPAQGCNAISLGCYLNMKPVIKSD